MVPTCLWLGSPLAQYLSSKMSIVAELFSVKNRFTVAYSAGHLSVKAHALRRASSSLVRYPYYRRTPFLTLDALIWTALLHSSAWNLLARYDPRRVSFSNMYFHRKRRPLSSPFKHAPVLPERLILPASVLLFSLPLARVPHQHPSVLSRLPCSHLRRRSYHILRLRQAIYGFS